MEFCRLLRSSTAAVAISTAIVMLYYITNKVCVYAVLAKSAQNHVQS